MKELNLNEISAVSGAGPLKDYAVNVATRISDLGYALWGNLVKDKYPTSDDYAKNLVDATAKCAGRLESMIDKFFDIK